jgi:hypothetical protein
LLAANVSSIEVRMMGHARALALSVLLPAAAIAQNGAAGKTTNRICLVPTSAQVVSGSSDAAIDAVRAAFTSFLTGPSVDVSPLTARLASQAREEARAANCPYVLLTTFKQERKEGRNLLGRAASGVATAGARTVMGTTSSAATRIAANAAASAAELTRELATTVRVKDELTLGYRLERADGSVMLDKSEKRKASSDGEDLLTPIVERAAEAIVSVVRQGR